MMAAVRPPLATPAEVAKYLRIPEKTFTNWRSVRSSSATWSPMALNRTSKQHWNSSPR